MNMRELVMKARSVRRFDASQPVSRDALRGLVDLARCAPCGGNQQKLRYRIVSDADECAAVFPHIAWAGALPDWPGPAEGERPTGYLAIVGEGGADTDTGIAAQTIQLAAAEQGLGCCMLGAIKRDRIKAALGLPGELDIKLLLALGVAAETIEIDAATAGDDLRYYRGADDVHHVPKLRLEDVLIA